MKNKILHTVGSLLMGSIISLSAFAEEYINQVCGQVQIRQTRSFVELVGENGRTFWLDSITGSCKSEISPEALLPGQVRLLEQIAKKSDPYVCLNGIERQGGCSAVSRIISIKHIDLQSESLVSQRCISDLDVF